MHGRNDVVQSKLIDNLWLNFVYVTPSKRVVGYIILLSNMTLTSVADDEVFKWKSVEVHDVNISHNITTTIPIQAPSTGKDKDSVENKEGTATEIEQHLHSLQVKA